MENVVQTILQRSQWINSVMRDEVRVLSRPQLNYVAATDTASVAQIVWGALASQRQYWSLLAGETSSPVALDEEDEEEPFEVESNEPLLQEIDATDALLTRLAANIDSSKLDALYSPREGERLSGITLLVDQISYAREQLARLQLTKQMNRAQLGPLVRPD